MRLLALIGLVGLLSACGPGIEEEATATPSGDSREVTQMEPPESWCRSYTTQKYCPSVCYWYSSPAPGYCGLRPTSIAEEPETTQMGPPVSWCNSYKTQRYCPSVCVWYSSPAPGYCGVAAES